MAPPKERPRLRTNAVREISAVAASSNMRAPPKTAVQSEKMEEAMVREEEPRRKAAAPEPAEEVRVMSEKVEEEMEIDPADDEMMEEAEATEVMLM
jgi:hypothetical protein